MADTQTVNFRWVMPEIGSAATTWGGSLNGDLADIDTQVFAAQQAGLPIGAISMFAGVGPPANWLICDGRSLSTTTYAGLFAVILYTYGGSGGSFNLPNMQDKFAIGAGPSHTVAATGGEATHVLTTAELPSHTHTITDPQHSHTVRNVMSTAAGGHQATGGAGNNIVDVVTQPASTGITITNATGSGTPHNNLPPYLVINFIIRAS
jgi:microcystin-dependent protein